MDHLEPQLIANDASLAGCHSSQKFWYAAYMRANHEKSVAEQLSLRSVEYFLPLYESVRCWKDRRVRLQLPLFPGYVFVRFALRDRLQVLEIPSVAWLVSFNGTPATLPDAEIEVLKAGLMRGLHAAPHPYLKAGRRVRITNGPLEGLEGVVIRKKNALRLVISLDLIQRSIQLEIDSSTVEPLSDRQASGKACPRAAFARLELTAGFEQTSGCHG
jgi:transcription antitermination factor NusG